MDERIIIVEKAFDTALCDKIVEQAGFFNDAEVITTDGVSMVDKDHRTSKVSWLADILHNPDIYNTLFNAANKANDDFYNFELHYCEHLQITQYLSSEEGMFRAHTDDGSTDPDDKQPRKLSVSVMLSEPSEYNGGDLVFYELFSLRHAEVERIKNAPKGTAIFFPSYLPHEVTPVTRGCRMSLVTWFRGPRFK
jgi:PKHD-type hydroxylase